MSSRSAQRSLAALALSGLVTAVLTVLAPAAFALVPTAPVKLPAGIEQMPPYQPQRFCDPVDKPGVVAFGKLLTATYKDTTVVDISRPCGTDTSEHYDGRALDWGVNVTNTTQRAQAGTVLKWLLSPDAAGHAHANLRRLGIMYIIWNKRIWGSWSQAWEPYACSGVTACHQDHMHFSFDWSGAEKKTSFWTGVVSTPMSPPNYVYRSFAFGQTVKVGSKSAHITPPFRVLGGATYRFTVSGSYRYDATTTHRADAECSTTNGTTWHALAAGDTSSSTGLLDLWVNNHRGWLPKPSNGTACNKTTHTYVRSIKFTTTTALTMFVDDPTHANNSGTLTIQVQRVA